MSISVLSVLGQASAKPTKIATPEQVAQECLAAARNNRDRALVLAGKRTHGARQRAVVRAIGNALLGAPAN
jgi:hypothetical protein